MSGQAIASEDAVAGPSVPGLQAITGVWSGSYDCLQGETGLRLTVEPSGRTEFEFYPLSTTSASQSGSYEMRAVFDGDRLEFTQVRWINRPGVYLMVDLVVGERTATGMRGTVIGAGCTTFTVGRSQS